MTDQEMMELAALAAGLELLRDEDGSIVYDKLMGVLPIGDENIDTEWWNPKDDDGDALRLAVKLRIGVICYGATVVTIFDLPGELGPVKSRRTHHVEGDEAAATRLAVLRAAAEMGKMMRENAA